MPRVFASGYRFAPFDVELIIHYLMRKDRGLPLPDTGRIFDVDLYQYNPGDLLERYMQPEETECYFFTPRKRKYKNGARPIRSAGDGYWKATGADLDIKYRKKLVGWRKTLVFYLGSPPHGKKTNWIMHEFKLNKPPITKTDPDDMSLDKWVLCKVYENTRRSRHPACGRYVDDIFPDEDQDINHDPSTIPTSSGNILNVANDGEQDVKHDIHTIPTNMRNIYNATEHALSTGYVHNPNSTYPTIQPTYQIPPPYHTEHALSTGCVHNPCPTYPAIQPAYQIPSHHTEHSLSTGCVHNPNSTYPTIQPTYEIPPHDTRHALSTGCVHNPNSTYPTTQPIHEIPPHHTKDALSTGCVHNPNSIHPTIQPIYEIPPHHNPNMIGSQPLLPVKSSQPHSVSDATPLQPHLTDSQPLPLTVVPPPSVHVQPQPFDGLQPDISTPDFDLDDDNLALFQNDPFWNDILRDSDSPPPK